MKLVFKIGIDIRIPISISISISISNIICIRIRIQTSIGVIGILPQIATRRGTWSKATVLEINSRGQLNLSEEMT